MDREGKRGHVGPTFNLKKIKITKQKLDQSSRTEDRGK